MERNEAKKMMENYNDWNDFWKDYVFHEIHEFFGDDCLSYDCTGMYLDGCCPCCSFYDDDSCGACRYNICLWLDYDEKSLYRLWRKMKNK